jgi:hypothetical protein
MGSTVKKLLEFWEYVNSLSLRDTHRLKKEKNETTRTFAVKKEIFRPLTQPHLIDWSNTEYRMDEITD